MRNVDSVSRNKKISDDLLPFTSLCRITSRMKRRERSLNLSKAPEALQELYKYKKYDVHLAPLNSLTSRDFTRTMDLKPVTKDVY